MNNYLNSFDPPTEDNSQKCELCGGVVIDGECDTCESRYVDGKRVPDEWDDDDDLGRWD